MSEPTRPESDTLEIPVDSPHAVTPTSSRRWRARATGAVLAVLVSGCVINPVPTPATAMGGGALDGPNAGGDAAAAADAVTMDAGASSADTSAAADAATTNDAGAADVEAPDAGAAGDAALPDDATATGDAEAEAEVLD